MTNSCFLASLGAVVSVFCCPSAANSEETVHWLRADFPPLSIPGGPHANTGHCDRLQQFVAERLKGCTHATREGNYKRILMELESEKNVACAALLKNPEREKYIAYSVPAQILLPNGVVIRKSQFDSFKPYLNKKGELSLGRIITETDLKLGYSLGRSYSGVIDENLHKHKERKNLIVRSGDDVFQGLLSMMLKGRVDYVLGYPTEAQYFAQQLGERNNIMFLPVEGMESCTLSYIGFPKNEWGKAMIAKIDPILLKARATPEFLAFVEYWLDEKSVKRYRALVKDHWGTPTKTRAKGKSTIHAQDKGDGDERHSVVPAKREATEMQLKSRSNPANDAPSRPSENRRHATAPETRR